MQLLDAWKQIIGNNSLFLTDDDEFSNNEGKNFVR